jgi:hypothetical protein
MTCIGLMLPDLRSPSFIIFQGAERFLEQQGRSRSEWGAGFSESRASLIARGFGNSAPAWLAKRSPAADLHPCISVKSVVKKL